VIKVFKKTGFRLFIYTIKNILSMKTSVEINGYTISIEESEGVISVNAVKDDEVVEEFTIQIEEAQEGEEGEDFESDSDIRKFDDFEEEEDFEGGEEMGQDDDEFESEDESEDEFEGEEDEDEDENVPQGTLESFQSFINKKTK
jgi:hypothetical protein